MDKYQGLNINMELLAKKRLIFASFFILQNKMQTQFDHYLEDISTKQWLIMIIASVFPTPPSLSEVANHAGCSRQNVKKIATVLEKKGFLELTTEKESRAVRIVLTQKFYDFYKPFEEKSAIGIEKIFQGLSPMQIEELFQSLSIIEENINQFARSINQSI